MKKHKYYLWVDTETAGLLFDDQGTPLPGQLMELSAILTDTNFNTIFEKNWVVKFDSKMVDAMQTDTLDLLTNNNLIDDCKKSEITETQVDNELMSMINQYTKNKDKIMLAGNSVYCDKEVIRRSCPQTFERIYYRVFDVSSVKELLLTVDKQVVYDTQNKKQYLHRAMPDIKESLNEIKDYWVTFEDVISSYR